MTKAIRTFGILCIGILIGFWLSGGSLQQKASMKCTPQEPSPKPIKEINNLVMIHPLRCTGNWVKSCSDFESCKESCSIKE